MKMAANLSPTMIGTNQEITQRITQISLHLELPSVFQTIYATRGHYLGPLPNNTVNDGLLQQLARKPPRAALLAGSEQILIVNEDTVSGHAIENGALLWEHDWPGHSNNDASASQAVPVPPDRVFVSKGYGVGSMLLALEPDESGKLRAEPVWRSRTGLWRTWRWCCWHAWAFFC